MDTAAAFAMGQANRGKRIRVFDWNRAAQIIRDDHVQTASAGLSGDWEWTGGQIFADGKPVPAEDTYTYLASTWAAPELMADGTLQDCWTWKDETDWDSRTYWPDSALAILRGEDQATKV